MKRLSLALLILLFAMPQLARGQASKSQSTKRSVTVGTIRQSDRDAAARAIAALKLLESEVIVYNSLGEFETNHKVARVPIEVFRKHLATVSAEVEDSLAALPEGRLKAEISNALHSFQDGAYWWNWVFEPRVVSVSELAAAEPARAPSDAAYVATIPYTVAINWRQASKNIRHAEEIANGKRS